MSAVRVPEPIARQVARARLRVVPTRGGDDRRIGFAVTVVALLVVGMFGLLFLQTRIQQQTFELADLGTEANRLSEREAALRTQLDVNSASPELMRRASEMGMVPAGSPGFLTLADGKVGGRPEPAKTGGLEKLRTRDQLAKAKAKADADAKARAEAAARAQAEAKAKAEAKQKAEAEAKAKADAKASAQPTPAVSPAQATPPAKTPAPQGA